MLDIYDIDKLMKAKAIICEVYEYNYGSLGSKNQGKLETVIYKLSKFISENSEVQK